MGFAAKFFNIKKGEGKPFFILFVHFFCFSAMGITAGSARDAFFLTLFEKTYLPLMYVAIAVVMVGVIPLYTKLSGNRNITRIIFISSMVFGLTMFPFTYFLSGWFIPLFYIWIEIMIVLTITQFWILAGNIFDVRQAKRLFGLISGSGAIASMVIGASIRPFVQAFGAEKLLFATAFFLGIISINSLLIRPFQKHQESESSNPKSEKTNQKSKKKFDKYLISLIVLISAMAIVSKFVDYQFKITASNAYSTQDELVNFFGMFYAVTGAAAFLVQFFLTSKILSKWGVFAGLIILPVTLFSGSIGFLTIPVLATIFIPKFADQVFKFTINNTTMQLLWLPVPPKTKQETKPIIDGTIKAFMEGAAGLTIFIAAKWIPLHLLSVAVLVIAALWIFFTFKTKNGYIGALQKAIEKRQLNFEDLQVDIADRAMVDTIDKTLNAGEEIKQLFALELIDGIPLIPWSKSLNSIFHHGSIEVQKKVLNISTNYPTVISNDELLNALNNRELANTAIGVTGKRKLLTAVPILETYLSDSDPSLQLNAAASLQHLESSKIAEAKDLIRDKMKSDDPTIQATAVRLLADQDQILTEALLNNYLKSPNEITRKAALFVAGKRIHKELLPLIISNLANPKTFLTARATLRYYPDDIVLHELITCLSNKNIHHNLLRGIVVTLKEYPFPDSIRVLFDLLQQNKKSVTGEVIDTLLALARQNQFSEELIKQVSSVVHKISNYTYQLIDFLNEIEKIDKNHLLNEVIQTELSKQIPFLLKLGIMDAPLTPVESYLQTIMNHDEKHMPIVFEVLDNIFSRDEKEWIMPLIENSPTSELIKIGEKHFENLPFGLEKQLELIICSERAWASAVAVDFVLRHEVLLIIQKLDWNRVAATKYLSEIIIKHNAIQKYGKQFQRFNLDSKELNMYSTLEKTILLKTVDLFQTIPSEDLSKVAQIATEIQFSANNSLFKKGDFGDSLYIIMNGEVEIHKGERHIATLKQGACLGEMALLDHEPRSADATIRSSEAILLKITQKDFYEIMSSNMEIMQGIVKLLTSRLREAIN